MTRLFLALGFALATATAGFACPIGNGCYQDMYYDEDGYWWYETWCD